MAVDITAKALDRPFQYLIPKELEAEVEEGVIVQAPFGNGNRMITGYVLSLSDQPKIDPEKIKPIHAVVTRLSDEEKRLTSLAVWIRNRYGSTLAAAMRTVLPARKKTFAKQKRVVCLDIPKEQAEEYAKEMRLHHQAARLRLMEALIEEGRLPYEVCTGKLHVTTAVIRALTEKGYVRIERERVYRNPIPDEAFHHSEVELNDEQKSAVDRILEGVSKKQDSCFLIQGVTGSGKTEVYIELITQMVSKGKQAIVLIPEIALTYQTLMRFYHRFGSRVSVIHSRMSAGEKQDQFDRAAQGDLDVMIGPRSALFTPFANLGIIVIDEEHEESYRSEQSPCYHAREVALRRGALEGACVVLGSATPSLEASYAARNSEIGLIRLNKRAGQSDLPDTQIVDLRDEVPSASGVILSERLKDAMRAALDRKEQIMLFLNRRGYSGSVICSSCGHALRCPHCDVSLTLHKGGRLTCHYCGHEERMPQRCPECGSEYLRTFRYGTEQVESVVKMAFPDAHVLRLDKDTASGKDGELKVLSAFAGHEADILIGTQMIVKGHDFPDVTLMGILMADLSLNVPDFGAGERTFQLLTQAAGRAGRAGRQGMVLIQTYLPEHYAVQCAAAQDYDLFYEKEISFRETAGYPPCGGLMSIHMSCPDKDHLSLAAGYIRKFLEKVIQDKPVQILGPTDEPVARIADVWRQVIYVKAGSGASLRSIRGWLEKYIEINEGFSNIEILYRTTV